MGLSIPNCCSSRNDNDINNQVTFNNGNIVTTQENLISLKDDKINLLSNINIDKNNIEQITQNFENLVKFNGEFIKDKTIEEILEETNPLSNKISLPENIEKYQEPNCFISPIIKFNNGEIYKGYWNINNQRHGYGINISPEGNIYKGLWKEDKIDNYGLIMDLEGNYYKGELKEGKFEGKGEIFVKDKSKYIGTFMDDYPNGNGILENYENSTKYNGDILNGKKEGKGKLEYKDGTIYEGDFKNDVYEGNGKLIFPNGRKYEGEFHDGKIKGKGKFTWEDGKIYEGEYEDFMKKGFGKFYWNENKYYSGQWLNNKQHGKGTIHYDGKEINGTFRFGKIIKENKVE